MVLEEQNIRFFIMFLILLGLLITLGVFLYIVVSGIILAISCNKSNETIKKFTNDKSDRILSNMLKIAFLLMISSVIILLLFQR